MTLNAHFKKFDTFFNVHDLSSVYVFLFADTVCSRDWKQLEYRFLVLETVTKDGYFEYGKSGTVDPPNIKLLLILYRYSIPAI